VGQPRYRRIVLKLSGEVLGGASHSGLDVDFIDGLVAQLRQVADLGTRIGIVVGGGNILRGGEAVGRGLGRVAADYIGMLGTVINGIAVRDLGSRGGLDIALLSSVPTGGFAEPHSAEKAIACLDQGRVVLFVGGTGSPFLTTDTAAALRAAEIGAEVLVKATKVDGVYSADPVKDSRASKYDHITFTEALEKDLGFMDKTALCICREASIPVIVFDVHSEDGLKRVVLGEKIGTVVEGAIDDK
jgi:uridylate kinase